MILYNTSNRPGAIEEAGNLYRALAAAGCQASKYEFSGSIEPLPWNSQDKYKNQHITLNRPNTALLLATMRGGLALRGVFTGSLANQFRKADVS